MRILILGSLAGEMGTASRIAIRHGAKILHAVDIEVALQQLRAGQGVDVVLADVRVDIARLIERLASERIAAPVVACGVANDSRAAVAAIRAGAKEYLPLPPDAEMIAAILETLAADSHPFIHADPRTAQVLGMADKIAGSDASVLILGPSGTGKEVLARYVHNKSRRAAANFVAVNCAAIPEGLLESELFGHEKGAFTGAVARRIGRFEEANNGTLLLDEISEMDPRLQAKLLRVLQERVIDRVGGTASVKVNVRILATSNRDLEQEVARGNFRGDLYFRLNVVALRMPALRERPDDIPVLARFFVDKYARANGLPAMRLAPAAEALLRRYRWPGNVRELENTMHRAVLLATGEVIEPEVVVFSSRAEERPVAVGDGGGEEGVTRALVGRTVADVERDLIIDTLRHCFGNRTQAATLLGISIRTLRNKLRQYTDDGLDVPPPGGPAATPGGAFPSLAAG